MAKLARENRLRERRLDKQARKDARKQAAADGLLSPEDELHGAVELEPEPEPTDPLADADASD